MYGVGVAPPPLDFAFRFPYGFTAWLATKAVEFTAPGAVSKPIELTIPELISASVYPAAFSAA